MPIVVCHLKRHIKTLILVQLSLLQTLSFTLTVADDSVFPGFNILDNIHLFISNAGGDW